MVLKHLNEKLLTFNAWQPVYDSRAAFPNPSTKIIIFKYRHMGLTIS